jgi:hypothetical protein
MAIHAPTKPGFYWAKWRIAAEGTEDNGEGCLGADSDWEVVDVFENSLDTSDDEYLLVHIPGVAKGQPIDNFYWGDNPQPLRPPQ